MKRYSQKVTKAAKKRLKEILDEHGIELCIAACGCCCGPSVRLRYKGEWITPPDDEYLDDFNFSNIGDEWEDE